jgi:hypothetical protein
LEPRINPDALVWYHQDGATKDFNVRTNYYDKTMGLQATAGAISGDDLYFTSWDKADANVTASVTVHSITLSDTDAWLGAQSGVYTGTVDLNSKTLTASGAASAFNTGKVDLHSGTLALSNSGDVWKNVDFSDTGASGKVTESGILTQPPLTGGHNMYGKLEITSGGTFNEYGSGIAFGTTGCFNGDADSTTLILPEDGLGVPSPTTVTWSATLPTNSYYVVLDGNHVDIEDINTSGGHATTCWVTFSQPILNSDRFSTVKIWQGTWVQASQGWEQYGGSLTMKAGDGTGTSSTGTTKLSVGTGSTACLKVDSGASFYVTTFDANHSVVNVDGDLYAYGKVDIGGSSITSTVGGTLYVSGTYDSEGGTLQEYAAAPSGGGGISTVSSGNLECNAFVMSSASTLKVTTTGTTPTGWYFQAILTDSSSWTGGHYTLSWNSQSYTPDWSSGSLLLTA